MGMDEEENIEQQAAARRERLKALKAAQQLLENPEDDGAPVNEENGADDEENDVNVKFRNYLPHDKQLQEGKLAPPELPKFEDPVASEPPVEEKKEDPFLNIAPKKPNWDLRRDVQKKLDKLEKRTQKAIFQLMGVALTIYLTLTTNMGFRRGSILVIIIRRNQKSKSMIKLYDRKEVATDRATRKGNAVG